MPPWERWDASHLRSTASSRLRDGEVVGWVAVSSRVRPLRLRRRRREQRLRRRATRAGTGSGNCSSSNSIASTEAAGIWTIQTGIFPENEASVRLHERVGFEVVGRRKRLGKLHGVWRDVLLLERRSNVVE